VAWVRYAKLESPTSHATQNPKLKSPLPESKNKRRPAHSVAKSEVQPPAFPLQASPKILVWAAVALFACGLLCKPMLVTLPLRVAVGILAVATLPQTPAKKLLLEKIPFSSSPQSVRW